MKKLLKWQLMEYRAFDIHILLGLLVAVTFISWLSHYLFHAPAHIVLRITRPALLGYLGGLAAVHFRPYTALYTPDLTQTLPLQIPAPQLRSLTARLLVMLGAGTAAAAAYLFLTFAFRHEPYVTRPQVSQMLLYAGHYIMLVSSVINMLAVRQLLKNKLALMQKPRASGKLPGRRFSIENIADIALYFFYCMFAGILIGITNVMDFSSPLPVLVIGASGAAITYINSCLLERYGTY